MHSQEEKIEELVAMIISEKIESFDELLAIQSHSLKSSEYQIGLYNGLVLGRSLLTGEEPQFYQQEREEEG